MKWLKENGILCIPIAVIILSLCLLPFLPDDIPMQFNRQGEANWTLPKYLAIWMLPALEGVLIAFNWSQRKQGKLLFIVLFLSILQFSILWLVM